MLLWFVAARSRYRPCKAPGYRAPTATSLTQRSSCCEPTACCARARRSSEDHRHPDRAVAVIVTWSCLFSAATPASLLVPSSWRRCWARRCFSCAASAWPSAPQVRFQPSPAHRAASIGQPLARGSRASPVPSKRPAWPTRSSGSRSHPLEAFDDVLHYPSARDPLATPPAAQIQIQVQAQAQETGWAGPFTLALLARNLAAAPERRARFTEVHPFASQRSPP